VIPPFPITSSRRFLPLLAGCLLFGGCDIQPPQKPVQSALEDGIVALPQLSLQELPSQEFAPWTPQAWRLNVWRLNESPNDKQASAQAWLGWTDEAIHVAVSVREPTRSVAGLDRPVFTGDSVEFAINTEPDYSGCWQVGISPPTTNSPARAQVFDYRKNDQVEVDFEYRVVTSLDGYTIEMVVPWKDLPVDFDGPGTDFHILININNQTRQGYERLRLPLLTDDPDAFNWAAVKLTGRAGPPIPVAAWFDARNLVELTLQAEVMPAFSANTFIARNDDRELGTLIWSSSRTPPRLSLPLTDLTTDEESQPIRIFMDDVLCGIALPPDLDQVRSEVLATEMPAWGTYLEPGKVRGDHDWARLEMDRHIVMMDMFPKADFRDPEKVRNLIGGNYELETTFYDEEGDPVERPWYPGAYGAITEVDVGDGSEREVRHLIYRIDDTDPIPMTSDEETALLLLAEKQLGRPWQETDRSPEEIALFWWHAFDKNRGTARDLPYFVRQPDGTPEEPLPLLVFLHGSGARSLSHLENDATIRAIERSGFPGLIVVPYNEGDQWHPAEVEELIAELEEKYPVDPLRIYLTGTGRGGSGTWDVAMAIPDKFAAIWPVAGEKVPNEERAWSRLRNLPAYVVWGEEDNPEAAARARAIVRMQQELGLDSTFLLLPGTNHRESYRQAYRTPEIYQWLLRHSRLPRPIGPVIP